MRELIYSGASLERMPSSRAKRQTDQRVDKASYIYSIYRVARPQLGMEKDVTLLVSGRGLDKIMPIVKLLYSQYRINYACLFQEIRTKMVI